MLTIIGGISCGEGGRKRSWKARGADSGTSNAICFEVCVGEARRSKARERCSIKPPVWLWPPEKPRGNDKSEGSQRDPRNVPRRLANQG